MTFEEMIIKLREKQKELDQHILEKEHERGLFLDEATLIDYTYSALRVEVAELQNTLKTVDGGFGHWKQKPVDWDDAKEEFSDVIHFIMSILNQQNAKISKQDYEKVNRSIPKISGIKLDWFFDGLFNFINEEKIKKNNNPRLYISQINELMDYFKLSPEETYNLYMKKHQTNYKRQEEGY